MFNLEKFGKFMPVPGGYFFIDLPREALGPFEPAVQFVRVLRETT